MKKLYTFALVFAAALFTLSCEKEVEQVTVPEEESEEMVKICIRGTLDKEISKTAYDADGKMTWVDGDKCALILNMNGDVSDQDRMQYTLEASYGDIKEGGRQADFYGLIPQHQNTSGLLSSGFAVYPVAVSQINSSNYYGKPFIKMPTSVSGEASSIVLIGTPNNENPAEVTQFNFKTAMGILKVNIANIPADATAIRLTSNDKDSYPVDGDFTLVKTAGVVTIGIENYQDTWGIGYQSVDISGEGAIASRDFFFNIPVGTYPANTLSFEVIGANNQVLMKRTISKALTFERNECITIPSLLYHRVWVNGSISAPGLYTVKPDGANTIRVHISNVKLTATGYLSDKSNWVNGNRFGASQENWNLTNLKNASSIPFLSAAGTYYLQYIVSSDGSIPASLSDASVMTYGSVPFKYMPSTDPAMSNASTIIGTYTTTANCGWHGIETSSMTITASDDGEKGNVMITSILGQSTNLYGTFASGVLTVSEDQTWYIDGSSATHRLCDSWDGTFDGSWTLKLAANNDLDLILGSSWLVNQWFTSSNGTDHYYNTFNCKK